MSRSDKVVPLADLRQQVAAFVAERDWEKFHAPKNLAMALAIEAAELMEHFQWVSVDESRMLKDDPEKLGKIGEEIADVFCYTLAMANELGIDLTATFYDKMEKNRAKYPADVIKGKYGYDDPTLTTKVKAVGIPNETSNKNASPSDAGKSGSQGNSGKDGQS